MARPEENQTEPPGRLTATSADSCRGGWVVRVLVAAAEGVVEGVDGLALEAESDVGVDAGRQADVGVRLRHSRHPLRGTGHRTRRDHGTSGEANAAEAAWGSNIHRRTSGSMRALVELP